MFQVYFSYLSLQQSDD